MTIISCEEQISWLSYKQLRQKMDNGQHKPHIDTMQPQLPQTSRVTITEAKLSPSKS